MEIKESDNLTINKDIKDKSIAELYTLCEDLRSFLLSNVSRTGGHLASNLGVVEITVALHNVFDTKMDRIVFDVGHQCYTHKILTGRKEGFKNLRAIGGISGFPNPEESDHDAFIAGHASTSVSTALGMARARTALQEDYSVIALIGDGALTGGLAYEGLSDAGQSGEPLIIILNDNEMSITKNVGGLAMHLARLRVRPYYMSVKRFFRKTIGKIPFVGIKVENSLRKIKSGIKDALLPSSMFENMGFNYLGPADGHNIKEVCKLLKIAKAMNKPTVIHLKTIKGKGYKFAEDAPEIFHGVPSFDVINGEPKDVSPLSFASEFGNTLISLAKDNKKICAITAAMQSGTGLDRFAMLFGRRFYDVGIAEGHAVTMAGGLAKQGMIPVCAIYSSFLQRSYDMIFHDVCLQNLHVVFAIDRAGLVGDDGQTHQGIYDVGMLLQMPNLRVFCPSGISEMRQMFRYAIEKLNCPVAIRYPRGGGDTYGSEDGNFAPKLVKKGNEIAILAYGRLVENAIKAAEMLEKRGISVAVIKLSEISNLTMNNLSSCLEGISHLFVVEECVSGGSVASVLSLLFSENNIKVQVIPMNLKNHAIEHGTVEQLMHIYGIDAQSIVDRVLLLRESEKALKLIG